MSPTPEPESFDFLAKVVITMILFFMLLTLADIASDLHSIKLHCPTPTEQGAE